MLMLALQVVTEPAKQSMLGALLSSPGAIALLITGVLTLLGGTLLTTEMRRRRVALATSYAFHIVEDLAREAGEKGQVLQKVAAGLRTADEWMAAQGWRALTPGEKEVAKLGFKALHGAGLVAEKVAEASALTFVKTTEAPTPPQRPPR